MYGTTQNGQDWCVKALHPSDPITEVRGIPDHSSVPTMFMNYQTTAVVTPANGSTGVWSLDGQLIPNPFSFGAYTMTDSVGTRSAEILNAQLSGLTHGDRLAAYLNDFTRWRLAYASVTIYQDGPDLANQGTVVVCQKPVHPEIFSIDLGNWNGVYTGTLGLRKAFHLAATDLPFYNASQAMPNAYFGKSREGVYIPLKLTHSHQAWHSAQDLVYQATNAASSALTDNLIGGRISVPTSASDQVAAYPFQSVNDLHVRQTGPSDMTLFGSLTSNFCNENWADFSFRNMAVTTSLSMFFRFGFECQVQPSSMLSPHLKLSPEYDSQAIDTYFKISRELKDAYPADFNDLGKIWDVISSVAKTIAPALSAIPIAGPALSMAVPAAAAIGDRIRGALRRASEPTRGSTASSSDLEIARHLEDVPPPLPPRPQRVIQIQQQPQLRVVTKKSLRKARRKIARRVQA